MKGSKEKSCASEARTLMGPSRKVEGSAWGISAKGSCRLHAEPTWESSLVANCKTAGVYQLAQCPLNAGHVFKDLTFVLLGFNFILDWFLLSVPYFLNSLLPTHLSHCCILEICKFLFDFIRINSYVCLESQRKLGLGLWAMMKQLRLWNSGTRKKKTHILHCERDRDLWEQNDAVCMWSVPQRLLC